MRMGGLLYCLHYAAWRGHTDIVRVLCTVVGVEVNIQDKLGYTALHYVARRLERTHF